MQGPNFYYRPVEDMEEQEHFQELLGNRFQVIAGAPSTSRAYSHKVGPDSFQP